MVVAQEEDMETIFDPPRQHKRVSLKKEVSIWNCSGPNHGIAANIASTGWTESIGEGGVCLITKMKVRVNQILRVVLRVGSGHIPTLIEVRWVDKIADSNLRFGAKFLF